MVTWFMMKSKTMLVIKYITLRPKIGLFRQTKNQDIEYTMLLELKTRLTILSSDSISMVEEKKG